MPSSNVNRALGLYRTQITTDSASSTRNETRRFNDQSRKAREVLTGDSNDGSFADVLRRVASPKH